MSIKNASRRQLKARTNGLREVLDERGVKYQWAASKMGIWPSQMSAVLQGTRSISKDRAEALCEAIGVPFFAAFVIDDGVDSTP